MCGLETFNVEEKKKEVSNFIRQIVNGFLCVHVKTESSETVSAESFYMSLVVQ